MKPAFTGAVRSAMDSARAAGFEDFLVVQAIVIEALELAACATNETRDSFIATAAEAYDENNADEKITEKRTN